MEIPRPTRCRASIHARKLRPSGKISAVLSGVLMAIAFNSQLVFSLEVGAPRERWGGMGEAGGGIMGADDTLSDEWKPVGRCEALGKELACVLRDGCEWCVNETNATGPSCKKWASCSGPPALCDLRQDNASCTKPLCTWCEMQGRCIRADGPVNVNGSAGSQVPLPYSSYPSNRPATQDVAPSPMFHLALQMLHGATTAATRTPTTPGVLRMGWTPGWWQGQCVGCDGVRDSGSEVDSCGTCAGPCVHP